MLTNASINVDYMTQSVLGTLVARTFELFLDTNSHFF
jgi:hypothetical protein